MFIKSKPLISVETSLPYSDSLPVLYVLILSSV